MHDILKPAFDDSINSVNDAVILEARENTSMLYKEKAFICYRRQIT